MGRIHFHPFLPYQGRKDKPLELLTVGRPRAIVRADA